MRLLLTLGFLISTVLGEGEPSATPADTPNGAANITGPIITPEVRAYLDKALKKWGVPGLTVVAVGGPGWTKVESGEGAWVTEFYNYGIADSRGNKVTENTLWGIGSNSKLFTALSIGTLIVNQTTTKDGKPLLPTTKIKDVLPEWVLMDQYASDHVDLTDLWGCRWGLQGHDNALCATTSENELVSKLRTLKPSAELRQLYQYNSMGFVTLADAVTTLTGMPYTEWVEKNIFLPLNMTSTTFNYTGQPNRADGFVHLGENYTECAAGTPPDLSTVHPSCIGTVQPIGWWNPRPYSPHVTAGMSGILSTGNDIGKWLKELLAPRVLNPLAVDGSEQPVTVIGDAPMPGMSTPLYAAGQTVTSLQGQPLIVAGGDVPGQHSFFARLPQQNIGLAIVTNDELWGSTFREPFLNLIIGSAFGLPEQKNVELLPFMASLGGSGPPDPLPASPSPAPASAEGYFKHPGYGDLDFKPMPKGEANTTTGEITAALARKGLPTKDVVYAITDDKLYSTHLTLTHWDGPYFNLSRWFVYEYGGKTFVPDNQVFPAVVTAEGMGVFGGYTSANVQPPEATTEDVANVAEVFWSRA